MSNKNGVYCFEDLEDGTITVMTSFRTGYFVGVVDSPRWTLEETSVSSSEVLIAPEALSQW